MANITQVNLTAGVPTGPAGAATASTIDALMADGGQATIGAQADATVAAGAAGTVSSKLRAISRDIGSLVTGTVLAAGTAVAGKFNVLFNGTTPDLGSGTGGAATQRVLIDTSQISAVGAQAASASVSVTPDSTNGGFLTFLAAVANLVSGAITTAMTGTTSTSLLASPGASLHNMITQVTVSNAHATQGTDIVLQDGSGGTAFYTIPAAANYGGATISFNPPLRQPTANTALFCANVTTGASTKVSAFGFKSA